MAANRLRPRLTCPALLGLLLLALPGLALAHRVNVFAYVEGDAIHVEAYFQRASPARGSTVEVINKASGTVYLGGRTNEQGRFDFPVPEQAKTDRADLEIRVDAGEGHQNRWTVKAAEYLPAASAVPVSSTPASAPSAPRTKAQAPAAARRLARADVRECPPPQELTPIVEAAVERKVAPLREMMLDCREPGLREIAGGIGYLVGIAGLLAYARSRRPPRDKP